MDRNQVREELHSNFGKQLAGAGKKWAGFKELCTDIGFLLGSGTIYLRERLHVLESRMEARLVERLRKVNRDTQNAKPAAQAYYDGRAQQAERDWSNHKKPVVLPKNPTYSHLLSEVLATFERVNGFQVGPDNTVPTYLKELSPEVFQKQREKRQMFKDWGVSPNHGEFTHRIQWYLLGGKLRTARFGDLYTEILQVGPERGRDNLWDYLFDRAPSRKSVIGENSEWDFRSPEELRPYLTGQEAALSFLFCMPSLTPVTKSGWREGSRRNPT